MNLLRSALIGIVIASSAFIATSAQAAAKEYQVTGVVLKLTDKLIVVQKADDEKFEINRTADLKIDGAVKVGSKITVYYTMTATSVENKDKK